MATITRPTRYLLIGSALLMAGCATSESAADRSIEEQVRARIAEERRISPVQLHVREENGVVSITGFIDTLEEQRQLNEAIADVRGFEGVVSVKNETIRRSSRQ